MLLKRCSKCNEMLSMENFAKHVSNKDQLQNTCRACQSEVSKKHYQDNKLAYKARAKLNKEKAHAENLSRLVAYLVDHPCVDCGETDPVVLTFDHVRGQKSGDVSTMLRRSSWQKVMAEIEKCDVRCANCHMRRTAKQFGWKILDY